jgi:peroxiredoxin Q/BCP
MRRQRGLAMKKLFVCLALFATAAFAGTTPEPQPPAVGSPAPAFSLTNQEGAMVSLDDLKGKWVVLYFYPKDFTSGCTLEAHNFQRDLEKYEAKDAVIVGISVDNAESHRSFCSKEHLNFKLLADSERSVAMQYGSVMQYNGNTFAARNTFLIDPKGVIRKVYLKVKPATHSDDVLADLQELRGTTPGGSSR